jgi:hypothetical protein
MPIAAVPHSVRPLRVGTESDGHLLLPPHRKRPHQHGQRNRRRLPPVENRLDRCRLRDPVILRWEDLLVVRNAERLSRMEGPVRIIQPHAASRNAADAAAGSS